MLNDLLKQHKAAILKEWVDSLTNSYQDDTSKFLKKQNDAFANPVGNAISQGLASLLDELATGMDHTKIKSALDPVIRIRAVQDFSPSQAIAFIFMLKKIIIKNLKKVSNTNNFTDEVRLIEMKIDTFAMIAFDIYMECREKINDLKANELRNMTFKAFERAGLLSDPV